MKGFLVTAKYATDVTVKKLKQQMNELERKVP